MEDGKKAKKPLKDVTEGPSSSDKVKASFREFINNFKIHKSPGKKEPFKMNSKILLGILAFVCIALIAMTVLLDDFAAPIKKAASYIVVPAQSGINTIGTWISERIDEFNTIQGLAEKNRELQKEIDELKAENNQMEQQNLELEHLRNLLDLKSEYEDYDTIAAKIISKDTERWFDTFIVNKGSKDGVMQNMNVVAQGGLAGVVIEVGDHYSTIRTVINDESNISASFGDSSDLCIVSGNLASMSNNIIDFYNASINAKIVEGANVVTSSVSSIYLPGLLIGYVVDFQTDGNELTQSGHVTPVVDFDNLSEVLIITQLKETSD